MSNDSDGAPSSTSSASMRGDSDVVVFGPRLAADIGGTLAKLVFFKAPNVPEMPAYVESDSKALEHVPLPMKLDPKLSIESPELGGEMRFLRMPSASVPDFIAFLRKTQLHKKYGKTINITGGGAFKYEAMIREQLAIDVFQQDEMRTTIQGLNFLTHYVRREMFSYSWRTHEQTFHDVASLGGSVFPYLLVNIGSGVSILKVTARDSFERVSGTSLGGGMFWGLCKLLTGVKDFDQVKQLSQAGDNSKVDLLVGDIYGTDYEKIGLSASVIASSFGKIASSVHKRRAPVPDGNAELDSSAAKATATAAATAAADGDGSAPAAARAESTGSVSESGPEYSDADIIRSLLFMTANNIAQIAYLNAERYKIRNVFFCGNFLNRNPYLWDRFSYAMDFWSNQTMKALFLLHDGYLGALGAFLESSTLTYASPRPASPASAN